jgi:hypothetical protein
LSADLSKARQQLWRSFAALEALLHRLDDSAPLSPGCLYLLRRKCGKPNCHCARGQRHEGWVLTRSQDGRRRLYPVPAAQRGRLRQLTAAWRRYQRARAAWVRKNATLLRQVDALAQGRQVPWPDRPNPAPPP